MPCAFKHVRGTLNIGGHVLKWTLDGGHDIANSSKVKYVLGPPEKGVVRHKAADVPPLEYQPVVAEVGKIFFAAADKIIDYPNLVTLFDQQIHHMAADETGAARNDGNWAACHFAPAAFMVRTL